MGGNQAKLSPRDFDDIRNGTKFSTDEINQWFSKFKKEFPKGEIRKYEFLVMYTKLFPKGDAAEFTDHIFRTYDLDGNGKIDFREFMVTVNIAQRGTTQDKLRWAFRLYDLNTDGQLTRNEIEAVLTSIYKAKSLPNATEKASTSTLDIFQDLDTNSDGFISEDEFVSEMDKCQTLRELLLTGF